MLSPSKHEASSSQYYPIINSRQKKWLLREPLHQSSLTLYANSNSNAQYLNSRV